LLSLQLGLILCSDTVATALWARSLFGLGLYGGPDSQSLPGTPLLLVLLIAALLGFVTAIIIGFFCVRLTGAYFALTSLAFQMFLFAVALKWRSLTNGDDGWG